MPDKRLIDANALMKNIGKIPQLRGITYGRMKKAVEETPTINAVEVVHGRWEWYEEEYNSMRPDGDYGWRCSCCKQDLAAELTLGIPGMHYAYDILDNPDNPPTLKRCVFCGAKMGGHNDTD